jgi:hypothetical protein
VQNAQDQLKDLLHTNESTPLALVSTVIFSGTVARIGLDAVIIVVRGAVSLALDGRAGYSRASGG